MHQIPERIDIDEASKACDVLIDYMRSHMISDEKMLKAIGTICLYVTRTKANVEWLETLVEAERRTRAEMAKSSMKVSV